MTALIQPGNVLLGNALGWYQPYVAASPPTLPADTVGFVDPASANIYAGTPSPTWPSPWIPWGASETGLNFEVQRTTADQTIEEQSTPVIVSTTAGQVQIVISFAEDTLETMKLSYGGGSLVTVAAATGTIGTRTLTLQEGLDVVSVGFEGKGAKGNFRRVLIPQMVATGNVQTPYRRAANNRIYPVTFRMISPMSSVVIKEWNAAALP